MSRGLRSRIEDAGLNASAPAQQRWIDGWLVRYSAGKAQRSRCIHALASGMASLDERLELCRALYAERHLPVIVRITPFTRPKTLDQDLAERGFRRQGESLVMALQDLSCVPTRTPPPGVQVDAIDPGVYAHIVGEHRQTDMKGRLAHSKRLRMSPVPYEAMVLRNEDGQVLAGAQAAREGALVGLYDVFTSVSQRNRGLARWLCGHLLLKARAVGAAIGYLQVDAANAPALAVYRGLGFTEAYRYHYRVDAAAAAG
jgi:ribosomal protein S18 acetylase RimI-like enzyme